jgi:hypothetical protein
MKKDPTGYWEHMKVKYSEDQPRDDQGRWTSGGASPVEHGWDREIMNTSKVGGFSMRRTNDAAAKSLAGHYGIAAPDLKKIFGGAANHNVELEIKGGAPGSWNRKNDVVVIARWKDDKGQGVARQFTSFQDFGGMKQFNPQELEVEKGELNDNRSYWTRVSNRVRETLMSNTDYYVSGVSMRVWPTEKEKVRR